MSELETIEVELSELVVKNLEYNDPTSIKLIGPDYECSMELMKKGSPNILLTGLSYHSCLEIVKHFKKSVKNVEFDQWHEDVYQFEKWENVTVVYLV